MKKTRLFGLLIAVMMLAATAFAGAEEEPAVVKVNDVAIGVAEAQQIYDLNYEQYQQIYAQNGLPFTEQDGLLLRDEVVKQLAYVALQEYKAKEYGYDFELIVCAEENL